MIHLILSTDACLWKSSKTEKRPHSTCDSTARNQRHHKYRQPSTHLPFPSTLTSTPRHLPTTPRIHSTTSATVGDADVAAAEAAMILLRCSPSPLPPSAASRSGTCSLLRSSSLIDMPRCSTGTASTRRVLDRCGVDGATVAGWTRSRREDRACSNRRPVAWLRCRPDRPPRGPTWSTLLQRRWLWPTAGSP